MSDLKKSQIKIEDLVERSAALCSDIKQRLADVEGADGIDEVERLQSATHKIVATVARTLNTMNEQPRPKVGDEVQVHRLETSADVKGTVIAAVGDRISVRVPEQIVAPVPLRIVPAYTLAAEWESEIFDGAWVDFARESGVTR